MKPRPVRVLQVQGASSSVQSGGVGQGADSGSAGDGWGRGGPVPAGTHQGAFPLALVAEEKLTPSPSAHVANAPVPVSGVSQGASLSAAGGQVEQHADVGRRHHPEEHSRLPLQEELQVLQTESDHHPKSHSGTPGQVQSQLAAVWVTRPPQFPTYQIYFFL